MFSFIPRRRLAALNKAPPPTSPSIHPFLSAPPPFSLRSRKLGHERTQYVVIHFPPLRVLLLPCVGIEAPDLALVHAQLQQLVRAIAEREVEGVEEYAVRFALDRRYELGVALGGEARSDVRHGSEDVAVVPGPRPPSTPTPRPFVS